jgi:hypothetical protein
VQVTEHREPPRIGSGDRLFDASLEQPSGGFRLRPFIAARHTRQLDSVKVGMVLLATLAIAIAIFFLGSWAMRSTLDWLAVQPPYQIPFKQIHLVNVPPAWFLGGKDALLESVRKSAGEPETISVLQVSSEQLAMSFKKYAWIEGAKVFKRPGQIDVELRYYRPVAWVQLSSTDQIVIDEKGVILPAENVDVPKLKLDGVIQIIGDGLSAPTDRRPGVVWKVRDSGGLERADERIRAAAAMASFLLQEPQKGDAQRSRALRIRVINVQEFTGRGLFIFNDEDIAILWGKAPGDEPPGMPTATEKWAMLRRWQETEKARFLAERDFWAFSNDRLRHICPPQHKSRHQPTNERSPKRTSGATSGSQNSEDREN